MQHWLPCCLTCHQGWRSQLPLSTSAFSCLPRLVRDQSRQLGKDVELVTEGGSTELHKTVLERMVDPLVHLIRNSPDHGIETPEQRVAANKPVTGVLKLSARQESVNVIIEIKDDGRGIDCNRVLNKAREKGFVSIANEVGQGALGVLLTGMGDDGARGLTRMHSGGSPTIVQDEESSAVWGMPGRAHAVGGADEALSLSTVGPALNEVLKRAA
jgi:two-component system chemotaxis sensor kinase CheA